MSLVTPFWFDQRQGKAEPAGTDMYKLTAPNMKPAFLRIQRDASGLWSASLQLTEDSSPVGVTEAQFGKPEEAWEAAFELFRTHVVV
jgi:hypothetical protein